MTSLDQMIAYGALRVPRDWRESLGTPPVRSAVRDRIEGMLLGLAIGDALGNTTEGQLPAQRRRKYGEIRHYLPNRYAGNRTVGLPSDDSQMAFWTLECLLADERIVPEHLAEAFSSRHIFGIGGTVRAFLNAYTSDRPWYEAAQHSAGNGALMRVAPVILPHLGTSSPALWEDAILAGAVTHNDVTSIGACVALGGMLWGLIGMEQPPEPTWWVDTYCRFAAPIEGDIQLRPRHDTLDFTGPAWKLVDTAVRQAVADGLSALAACNRWYSGAYLLETVPSAVYILARHGHDPAEAIVRAVNDTKDNDSIAAIVGAAVGALHGRSSLPQRWIEDLLGRTGADDDGRMFELIDQAGLRWASDRLDPEGA